MSGALEADLEPDLVMTAPPRFVLVTGTGRSGTSTVAGSLNLLGLHLPRPVLRTNDSNPRGFYESKWAITFHRKIMDRAGIDTFDARPEAWDHVRAVLQPNDRRVLEDWLRREATHAPQTVVKDPRSAWMPGLWADAAADVGLTTGYVAMLRHPAEVIGSRSTYYAKGDEAGIRRYRVMSVARWVNATLITERQTRHAPRAFVRYYDLIDDWRTTLAAVGKDLDLTFNTEISSGEPHAVDEFIDPSLRRHQVTWDELDVPAQLRQIAEETWQAACVLADHHGYDDEAESRLDDLTARYATLFRDAAAITHDVMAAAVRVTRKKVARETRVKLRKEAAGQDPEPSSSGGPSGIGSFARRAISGGVRRVRGRVRPG